MARPTDHVSPHPKPRRTQRRSQVTTDKLLAAAVEVLIREGWAHLSTTRISEVSGVSRGAQQHHFPSRASLVAAAMPWLMEKRAAELMPRIERASPQTPRVELAIDALWDEFSGDLFEAATELWIAARTDAALRVSLREMEDSFAGTIVELCRALFGPQVSGAPDFDDRLQLTVSTMRGIALLRFLQFDARALDRQWAYARAHLIALFR